MDNNVLPNRTPSPGADNGADNPAKTSGTLSNAMLPAIMDSMPHLAICAVDDAYRLLFFNRPFNHLIKTAFGPDAAEGMNLLHCLPEARWRHVTTHIDKALKGIAHKTTDSDQGTGDPGRAHETMYHPLRDEGGQIIGVTVVSRDMNGDKQPDISTPSATIPESLDQPFRNIVHDFNNLLSGLFGYIEVAKNNVEKNNIPRVSVALERASKSYENAIIMARQLQALAKRNTAASVKNGPDWNEGQDEPASTESPITPHGPDYQGAGTILVLDDEACIRDMLSEMLESMGHTIVIATTGEEALSLFDAAMQSDTPIVACILDLTIPEGMGGEAVAERLIPQKGDTLLLATSGYSEDPIMTNPKEYGFDDRLIKPFRTSELAQLLSSHLDTH
ncbi:MAG: response regulator [Deltaproteobacteria bacterium]|nr:response regulator [Deltaproteobacteria bacterium]